MELQHIYKFKSTSHLEKVVISIKQTFECIKILDLYINYYAKLVGFLKKYLQSL